MSYLRLGVALSVLTAAPALLAGQDSTVARRLAASAQLAADEYRLGVSNGRVVVPAEVQEAKLFLSASRRDAAQLPPGAAVRAGAVLDRLDALISQVAAPDSVAAAAAELVSGLATDLNLVLDRIPDSAPSLSRGRDVYRSSCAGCHGETGRGDGPQAAALNPRPASLTDPAALAKSSPLDFYRRITVGTAGTAMPPYEHLLSDEDRWAVALYASTLRLPAPRGGVPERLRSFARTAGLSDDSLRALLGPGATGAELAAVRLLPTPSSGGLVAVFADVRHLLDSAYALAAAGRGEAARGAALDAYLSFERVELQLRARDPGLTSRIEAAFAQLQARTGSGAAALGPIKSELARELESAERSIGDRSPPSSLFAQSFVILVREGLEAILVIGALMAFLVKSGNGHRRRDIHLGVGAAILMSLVTAAVLETVFMLSRSHQEGLEGGVMLLAAVTLFYVSYWLLSKLEVAQWNRFVRGRMESALSRGSALALASVAFLAVYREGFETVLFYKALAVSGGPGDWAPIGGGILAGAGVLAVVYLAINRFGVRLPLKPLFAVTSALLYYMAVVFAGKGVAELQESGGLSLTPVAWAPRLPALGIYPTVESLAAQALLLALALVGLIWIFVIEPGRQRRRAAVTEPPLPPAEPSAGRPRGQEMLRSIERIETDLAEVHSELERMRKRVTPSQPDAPRRPGSG